MNILVVNCGSSSQNFKVYRVDGIKPAAVIASCKARHVATHTQASPRIDWHILGEQGSLPVDLPSHRQAAIENLKILRDHRIQVDAIGHRFVHGGELFTATTWVDQASASELRKCFRLAPIHNPNSYRVIEACMEYLPDVPQFAVFDTAFHAGLPEAARRYAIPKSLAEKYGFRKYGFHGLSYQYVSARAAEMLGKPLDQVRLVMCHLGTGGSSVAAFKDGHSVDTSMGWSPLPGLVMSTRSGDIDPGIILELVRSGYTADEIDQILNNQSGMLGLSGYSSNLAEVIQAAESGSPDCQAAYDVYSNRLKLYIGGYYWMLGGADAIVFTDEIGTHAWQLRQQVCIAGESLGVLLDEEQNRSAPTDAPALISRAGSATAILTIPTDEEWVILQEVLKKIQG